MNTRNGLSTTSLSGFFDSPDDFGQGANGVATAVTKAAEQAKSVISNQVDAAKSKIEQATQTAKAKIESTAKTTAKTTATPNSTANAAPTEIDPAYKSVTATVSGVVVGSVASVIVYKHRKKKGLLVPALAGVASQAVTHAIVAETIKRTR